MSVTCTRRPLKNKELWHLNSIKSIHYGPVKLVSVVLVVVWIKQRQIQARRDFEHFPQFDVFMTTISTAVKYPMRLFDYNFMYVWYVTCDGIYGAL